MGVSGDVCSATIHEVGIESKRRRCDGILFGVFPLDKLSKRHANGFTFAYFLFNSKIDCCTEDYGGGGDDDGSSASFTDD